MDIPISDVVSALTLDVRVTGMRTFWIRQKIALVILRTSFFIVSVVGGVHINVAVDKG